MSYFGPSFAERGVRVVTIDRPGYGRSAPHTGRRLADWPADVAAVADELGVARFAVTGMSAGGPYAVVCAVLLPDRVVNAGVLSGVGDFGWSGAWDGYAADQTELMRMGYLDRISAWVLEHYGPDGMGFLEGGLGELAPADYAVFENEALASALTASVGEAFAQGAIGYAQDVVVQTQPWPFDPAAVTTPIQVLHGDADTVVPLRYAQQTADVISTVRLQIRPGQGHISLLLEIPELAADLVTPLR